MDDRLGESSAVFAEEADKARLFRSSPVVPERVAEEIQRPTNSVAQITVSSDGPLDLSGQLRTNLFVGVKAKNPGARRLIDAKVLLGPEPRPVALDHPRAEDGCFLPGPVVAVGIDDDRLGGPGDTAKAALDVPLFVPGDYHD